MNKHKPESDWPTRRAPKAEREAFAEERFARAPIARALFLGDPEPLIEKMKEKGLKLASVDKVLKHMVGAREPGPRKKRKRVRIRIDKPKPSNVEQLERWRAARDKNIELRAAWRINSDTGQVEDDVGKQIRWALMAMFRLPPHSEAYLISAQRRQPRKEPSRK